MAERGAQPQVPKAHRRALRALRAFFTPLLPDDYLEQINPMWTTRELRGRIEDVSRETDDAVTVTIRPSWRWPGHGPGQYLRIGLVIDGRHHWRAYSLTSDPDRDDGRIAITPKLVEAGHRLALPAARGPARDDRAPRRGRGHVRAARPGPGAAAVRHRGQRRSRRS